MDFVVSYYKIGNLLIELGKKSVGKDYIRKALDIMRSYKDKSPLMSQHEAMLVEQEEILAK